MSAALPNNDPLNGRAADRTGLSFTIIYAEVILKSAAAINPIETGTVVLNTGEQDGLNSPVKPFGLIKVYCI